MLDRLIFFPDRSTPPPPAGVTERWITTPDGIRLHAWYAGKPDARATLVWSHGNGGNIADRTEPILGLAARGLAILAYDYRGYGRSTGTPSEPGVYVDAEAAWDDEYRRGTPPTRLIAFGESLGGAVSIALATRRPCRAVAVVSTFTTLRDVARAHYGPLSALTGTRFDSLSRVGDLRVSLFIAHGDRDEIVPYTLGERLYDAAREPKRFVRIAGAGHNDIFEKESLLDEIARFAREVVA